MAHGAETRMFDADGNVYPSHEACVFDTRWRAMHARFGVPDPAPDMPTADVPPIEAHVSQDIWCADCPDCGGAEMVWTSDLRMWCHACGNVAVGGGWRPVKLPAARDEIERILANRPQAQFRNWHRPETLDDLRAQNVERGDPD